MTGITFHLTFPPKVLHRRAIWLSLAIVALTICIGCSTAFTGPDRGGWEKDWNATTCDEFLTKMTEQERTAFARFSLGTLREGTLETAPEAPAAVVSAFSAGIASLCREPDIGADYSIVAASAVVYVGDKQYEPVYR